MTSSSLTTANTSKLLFANLDFATIKASLIGFMQSQDIFKDYDFTGSGLNTIIDLLTVNTLYNAVYMGMLSNESFLDTAVLRSTVVSHAKEIGYTPRSTTSAQANVNVVITAANADTTAILNLPRFTTFSSAALSGNSYIFSTLDDAAVQVSVANTGNTFNFPNVTIKEGAPTIKTFIMNTPTNPLQVFDLVDQNIDTSTVQVIVQESVSSSLQTYWQLATDATTTSNTSNVYFIQESSNGSYQIYFGDGVIGASLNDGNIVILSYLISSGNGSNGLATFQLQSAPLNGAVSNVTTLAGAAGGSPRESVSSIKFSAPLSYIAQNRCVTKNDYIALINKNYPYFNAINIWGGEEVTPPQYGQVFISAVPMTGFAITNQQQQYLLTQIIAPYSVLTVTPVFVQPDFDYLLFDFNVTYDSTQTPLSAGQVEQEIITSVLNYANTNYNTFNSLFVLSQLLKAVDASDNSLIGSTVEVWIEKRFYPSLTSNSTYTLNTGMILHHGTGPGDGLYSTPGFTILDASGITRTSYLEEVPSSYSGLSSVTINASGSGYITAPTLVITGDGTGANAYATIINGKVATITVDSSGSNYTTASIIIVGGSGSGASLSAVFEQSMGTLRTYYFDQNNNKVILNADAGSILYNAGQIILTNFAPTGVLNTGEDLSIIVQPGTYTFSSQNEIVLTVDPTDQTALTINLSDIATT